MFNRKMMVFAALALMVGLAPIGLLAADCRADVDAFLDHEGEEDGFKIFHWKVDVTVDGGCGNVNFQLIAEVQGSDGTVKERKVPQEVRVSDSTESALVKYKISDDQQLVSWKFEVTGCRSCPSP